MKKIKEKIESALISAKLAMGRFASEERGDTNFLSIAIILVVVLALAVVFIAFGDELTGMLNESTDELFDALGK